jgi:hypothetical protein
MRGRVDLNENTLAPLLECARPISGEEFSSMFTSFKTSAWRLELLSQYIVPGEKVDFESYLNGEPFPRGPDGQWWRNMEDWRNNIQDHVAHGRSIGRVHVLPEKLTPYILFEIEWGYCYSAHAGDDVRFLEHDCVTDDLRSQLIEDFWLFDDKSVVLCDYESDGTWIGARILEEKSIALKFIEIKDLVLKESIDLRTFLKNYRTGKYSL